MKRRTTGTTIALLLAIASIAHGESLDDPHKHASRDVLWRSSLAALAVASVADIVSSYGQQELNPVLGQGRFQARQVGVKLSLTGGLVLVELLVRHRRPETSRSWSYANYAASGVAGAASVRNWSQR